MAGIAFANLRDQIAGDVLYDEITRALYATDASIYRILPAAVACPKSAADVQSIVRFAAKAGFSVIPRGAGSGLAGESVGPGIIIDFSRYMNRKIEIDPERKTARVEPGVVLATFNARLAEHDLLFGPDPASGNRCTLGGMIANNSTGAHSIKYGFTRDYLVRMTVVLANGELVELGDGLPVPEALMELDAQLKAILARNATRIEENTPKVTRNRSGYLLRGLLRDGVINYPKLIASSEGTLGIICEATLRVVDKPRCKGLAILGFPSLQAAVHTVVAFLPDKPGTVEMIDDNVIRIGSEVSERFGRLMPPDAKFLLVVEHDGEDAATVRRKLDKAVASASGSCGSVLVEDTADQDLIWATRNEAEPFLFRENWPLQPLCFVEDVAVAPKTLPDYLERQAAIFQRYGVRSAYYAHAGHGELHVKPYLNLRQPEDRAKMTRIAEEVHDLAIGLGGTISGEHGEGLLRAPFIRKQYGDLYETFVEIKNLFDPNGLLNPGKKINDATELILDDLRVDGEMDTRQTRYRYDEESVPQIVDNCNGCAACRTVDRSVDMCPIFKVVGEEAASPRAKANVMRELMTGNLDPLITRSRRFKELADLCINCKMCHLECPSGVDIPKLMLDAKAMHVAEMGLTLDERIMVHAETFSRLAAPIAPVVNALGRVPFLRRLGERITGIDHRRKLPDFARRPFLRRHQKTRGLSPLPQEASRKVAYFVDLYANYNDPSLAEQVVAVLEHNGLSVVIPDRQQGCGMPAIDHGDLKTARRQIKANLDALAKYSDDGVTIVTAEPTAALTLKEEYLGLTDDPRAEALAGSVMDVCEFLWRMHEAGDLKTSFTPVSVRLGYHAPCHLKALKIGRPGLELVRLVPGVAVTEIDEGCCGIAGTYGFKRSGYDNSMKIGAGLFRALRDPAIDVGLTECSTCKMQMEQGAAKPTLHPITVLAMAYGLKNHKEL